MNPAFEVSIEYNTGKKKANISFWKFFSFNGDFLHLDGIQYAKYSISGISAALGLFRMNPGDISVNAYRKTFTTHKNSNIFTINRNKYDEIIYCDIRSNMEDSCCIYDWWDTNVNGMYINDIPNFIRMWNEFDQEGLNIFLSAYTDIKINSPLELKIMMFLRYRNIINIDHELILKDHKEKNYLDFPYLELFEKTNRFLNHLKDSEYKMTNFDMSLSAREIAQEFISRMNGIVDLPDQIDNIEEFFDGEINFRIKYGKKEE
jgi:hypothetical protein